MSERPVHSSNLRSALSGALLLGAIITPAQAAFEGDTSADIIEGCNQFIKFSHKGVPPRDADKLRRIGECIGAVRTTLAFGVKNDEICPPSQAKLIDAVTIFSLHVLHRRQELTENYIVAIRRALIDAWPCTSVTEL